MNFALHVYWEGAELGLGWDMRERAQMHRFTFGVELS